MIQVEVELVAMLEVILEVGMGDEVLDVTTDCDAAEEVTTLSGMVVDSGNQASGVEVFVQLDEEDGVVEVVDITVEEVQSGSGETTDCVEVYVLPFKVMYLVLHTVLNFGVTTETDEEHMLDAVSFGRGGR